MTKLEGSFPFSFSPASKSCFGASIVSIVNWNVPQCIPKAFSLRKSSISLMASEGLRGNGMLVKIRKISESSRGNILNLLAMLIDHKPSRFVCSNWD